MSLTLLVWISVFATLSVLAFVRPAWGVALYLLTFFACPQYWWWGEAIDGYRWNLYGGAILLAAVLVSKCVNATAHESGHVMPVRRLEWLAALILINATLVHLLLASRADVSSLAWILLAKFVMLFFLIKNAIRSEVDLRNVLLWMLIGAAYIGFEATINHRGAIDGNRLEGIGAPGAANANQCASLMVTILPLCAAFFLAGNRWGKLLAVAAAPLILNVIILCNSRGAFLAAIASAIAFLVAASPQVRRKAALSLCLGALATWFLLGDQRVIARFATTFASQQELDASAAGRLDYWRAGIRMIADYPLGAGGNGFKKVHGPRYIAMVGDTHFKERAIHNGYLNEACEWGVQGLLLRGGFIVIACGALIRISRSSAPVGNRFASLSSAALFAGMVGFLVTCLFGDRLDNEWGYWLAAIAAASLAVYAPPSMPRRRP